MPRSRPVDATLRPRSRRRTLTAEAAPTFDEIAAIASELTGQHIECEAVDPEEWVSTRIAAGQNAFLVRFALGIYQAAERGYFAGTDPLLGVLLGRAPRTVRDLLAEPTPPGSASLLKW